MSEFDMEVTEERLSDMKKLLVMLYADQIGKEVKSIRVRPKKLKDENTKAPA